MKTNLCSRGRTALLLLCGTLALAAFAGPLQAQTYSIPWYKVSGGGGASSNGQYVVNGTIGQHDAGGPMTGNGYSLTGGFWALYAVQTPGLPLLSIKFVGPDSAVVSWADTGNYTLQTNGNLESPAGWANYGSTMTTNSGVISVAVTPPTGKLFFRLENP